YRVLRLHSHSPLLYSFPIKFPVGWILNELLYFITPKHIMNHMIILFNFPSKLLAKKGVVDENNKFTKEIILLSKRYCVKWNYRYCRYLYHSSRYFYNNRGSKQ